MLSYKVNRPDQSAMKAAKARWDAVAKPLDSLGRLEKVITRIAGIQGTPDVALTPRCGLIFCADHGIVAQGVSQTDQSVTALVARAIAAGTSNVNIMASVSDTPVYAVDVGMATDADVPGIIRKKTLYCTKDMSLGPAMTRDDAEKAIQAGIDTVREMSEKGIRLIALGEMGIGNTSATAAVCCALLGMQVNEAVDRGAGLSDEGLSRKRIAVQNALSINKPDAGDPIDVLAKVGGLELCAMAGACLGSMSCNTVTVIDGVIVEAAALAAYRLCPECREYMFASHIGKEPAAARILEELDLKPLICAELALGEGTGAVAALPLMDMAQRVYAGVHTFDGLGMAAYREKGGAV
ncbi:MAG: nicotinate-nucleotide--dimethylbenzimidazole phosphoribosyltransferase [Clostridia bacterium]|nr:nicotinate-nucleotide--dimethylbenzimidazole phosphoribosyltransferase [Clostridia bacterium]